MHAVANHETPYPRVKNGLSALATHARHRANIYNLVAKSDEVSVREIRVEGVKLLCLRQVHLGTENVSRTHRANSVFLVYACVESILSVVFI